MSEEFVKIRKKRFVTAVLQSVGFGVSAGLFFAGALLLALKLSEIEIHFGYYILAGCVAALLVGGLLFLILRPTDVKIAKRLDRDYSLSEKIQTMVEFSGNDEGMVRLQRENASECLQTLPRKKINPAKLWHYAAIPLVAVALFVSAVAIPAKTVQSEYIPPFNYTDRQRESLKQLVADVNRSNLSDANKQFVSSAIEDLSDTLETVDNVPDMKSAVITSVAVIDAVLYTANSFDNAAAAFDSTEEGKGNKYLSTALEESVMTFRAGSSRFTLYEQVEAAEKQFEDSIGGTLALNLDEWRKTFEVNIEDGVAELITAAAENVKDNISHLESADAITLALDAFALSLEGICVSIDSGINDVAVQTRLNSAFTTLKSDLLVALIPQTLNCIMDEYVRIRIASVFGLALNELPALFSGVKGDPGTSYEPPKDDDDDKSQEGGYGKGDNIYGGDDYIYHPQTGELSPYGDHLEDYYSKARELLEDDSIPENVKKYIEEYFNILYRGIQNSDKENK